MRSKEHLSSSVDPNSFSAGVRAQTPLALRAQLGRDNLTAPMSRTSASALLSVYMATPERIRLKAP